MGIHPADSAGWRQTVQHIICCLSKGPFSLYKRHKVIEPVLNEVFRASTISLRLRCIRGTSSRALKKRKKKKSEW
jgi:hypothetical protein